jgi:tagatose 6-phosphate kinase
MIICLGTTPTVQRTMTFGSLTVNDVNRATSVRQFASGKSVNAARVVHTLGEPVIATGIVGGDSGTFLKQDLDTIGLRQQFVESRVPTRLCLTLVDETRRTATELIEESSDPGGESFERLLVTLRELLDGASVLVMSGTLAPGAGDDFYAKCVRRARDARVPTILDARDAPLMQTLPSRPTVVKPNRAELASSLGVEVESEESLRDAMREIVRLGAEWVVVTGGAQDTRVSDGEGFWRVTTPQIQVVNPIGSGDAFAGGLAVGLHRGQEVPTACRLASACAAANAMTVHAGHVHESDVQAQLARVSVAAA